MKIYNGCNLKAIFLKIVISLTIVRSAWEIDLIKDVSKNLIKSKFSILFGCSKNELLQQTKVLQTIDQFVTSVNLNSNFSLNFVLKTVVYAKTFVVLDTTCADYKKILIEASSYRYFNKSYNWIVLDKKNIGVNEIFANITNIGLNSQLIYVNHSENVNNFYDVYSTGRHLKAPLEIQFFAEWYKLNGLKIYKNLNILQGIENRKKFNGLTLRGVTVIDRDKVNVNQIDDILKRPTKTEGVTQFVKYHYMLVSILRDKLNFTINYRITRTWTGRLGPSRYRLGLLGVVKRNEADIAASGTFSKINRLAEFDTIHQSWKFESGFLFRMTPDIKVKNNKFGNGNFLAPFEKNVWILSGISIIILAFTCKYIECIRKYLMRRNENNSKEIIFTLIAAICQQGFHPIPTNSPVRIIVYFLVLLCLLLHSFYTSSIVGTLLGSQLQGPRTLQEIIESPLILSFEDVGYHRIFFKETNLSIAKKMYKIKIIPARQRNILPVYTQIKNAIPYIKNGGYAFHCEMIDAFPEIARHFDASEICDLRSIPGIFDIHLMNLIVPKRSQYTETFRIIMHRAREIGLINRSLRIYRPDKPKCQTSATVHPVALNGVLNAFMLLGAGMIASVIILICELLYFKRKNFLQVLLEKMTQVISIIKEKQRKFLRKFT